MRISHTNRIEMLSTKIVWIKERGKSKCTMTIYNTMTLKV